MAETKKKVSSTTWIVLSMVLGVIAGFDIGEPMTQVKFIGDIFFHLVQMGIIPFVMCTIIEAVGALDAKALSGANVDEKAMGRIEAIIQSMTPGERDNPAILNSSRKKRIAAGAGTCVVEINKLLKQFELMQQLVRQMSGNSKAMKRMKRGGRGGFGGLGNLFGGGGRPYGF